MPGAAGGYSCHRRSTSQGCLTRFEVQAHLTIATWLAAAAACTPHEVAATLEGQVELSREHWLAVARRALLRENCATDSHFRRCGEIERDECEHVIARSLGRCALDWGAGLPERVAAGSDDRQRRAELIGCTWHHAGMELGPARVNMVCLLTPG